MMSQFFLSGLIALTFCELLPLQGAATFGAEWEFSNTEMLTASNFEEPTHIEHAMARRFADAILAKCPGATLTKIEAPFFWAAHLKIDLPEGFYILVNSDPRCVEINTQPATIHRLQEVKERLNTLVFGTAEELGLSAHWNTNSGHMNFGTQSMFGDDLELFMLFLVDYANHPQLAAGAWGDKAFSAPPLNWLYPYQRQAFSDLVVKTREGVFQNIQAAAKAIFQDVYCESLKSTHEPYHYQAIGLKYLVMPCFPEIDAPCEIRNFYPQFSVEDFIRNAEIIENRVSYLRTNRPPLVYFGNSQRHFASQDIVDNYYMYLTEMDMDWNQYKTTMHPKLQAVSPSDFTLGKISWTSAYAHSVRKMMCYLPTSQWARTKLQEAFSDPLAQNNPQAQALLKELVSAYLAGSLKTQNEVEFVQQFISHSFHSKKHL